MQRDYRLLQEGMRGHMLNFKAHLLAVLHLNTPGFKRFKFVNYLHNDEDIIPIQFIDWSRERPILTHRGLDFYLSGKLNLFCLEPQYGVEPIHLMAVFTETLMVFYVRWRTICQ